MLYHPALPVYLQDTLASCGSVVFYFSAVFICQWASHQGELSSDLWLKLAWVILPPFLLQIQVEDEILSNLTCRQVTSGDQDSFLLSQQIWLVSVFLSF